MDHIELSSAEVEKTLNDTACCVLILDIALSWTIVNKVDRRREKNQKRSSN